MSEKYILRGAELKVPDESFGQILYRGLKIGKSKVAMVDAFTNEEITYSQILQRSVSLALCLKQRGISKNDAIAVCSENSLGFTIPSVTALFLGATIAPVNHFYTPGEIVHVLNISKPKMIFCSENTIENVLEAVKSIKIVQEIILLNACSKKLSPVKTMKDLMYISAPENYDVTPMNMEDVAAIMCSSGTTGLPKGVMLTHKNFNAAYANLKHPGFGGFAPDKVATALLPFYHAYGFVAHLASLVINMKMVIYPRFEENTFLKSIEQYKITMCILVPPLVMFLGQSPLVEKYDLSSVNEIICGAAPLSGEVQDSVMKRLNVKIIRQGYGLTESTLGVSLQPPHIIRTGTIGVVVPNVECKIRDMETNKALGPFKRGEMCFRGAVVMKGYVGDQKATSEAIDQDGWLRTGDIGYYDHDGYLYIVDRFKELIKYKGFQVPPAEIEGILLKHPDIKDCAVVGKPDKYVGELPIAFVVKQTKSSISEQDVIDFVAKNVSYQKRLHGGVKFVNTIPKNATGKILRRILREQVELPANKL